MRIAMITPSVASLNEDWPRDRQNVKLGAPTVSGYLHACGYHDIRQYEFENELHELEIARPGKVDLTLFDDVEAVDAWLADDRPNSESRLGRLSELIVDTLRIEEADLYGFSCSAPVQPKLADSRAVAHQSICLAKVLRQRYPRCKTVLGGIQVGSEEFRIEELERLHRSCAALDFTIDGQGEPPMLHIVEHLTGKRTFEQNHQRVKRLERGTILLANPVLRPSSFQLGSNHPVVDDVPTPDGDVKPDEAGLRTFKSGRRVDLSLTFSPPYFDPIAMDFRRRSGREILYRYGLPKAEIGKLAVHHDRQVLVVPMIFMLGCNARCAFCPYSEQGMSYRDIDYVIRSIAWLQEKHQTRYFHFLNTNINANKAYAREFAEALIESKLDILWSDSLNLRSCDEELLEKLRTSGLIRLVTGIECPSDRMLKLVHKGMTVRRATELLQAAHDLGIWTHNQFIAGMPTETEADLRAFVDFIEATRETTNAYSVSPFYLDMNSLMWADPERYGVRVVNDPEGLQEAVAFDEIDGLEWAEKKPAIDRTASFLRDEIARVKGSKRYNHGALDLDLLFYLYDILGHDNKAEIVRLYEAAIPGDTGPEVELPAVEGDLEVLQQGWAELKKDRALLDEQRGQLVATREKARRSAPLVVAEGAGAEPQVGEDARWGSELGIELETLLGRSGQNVPELESFCVVGLEALNGEEFLVSFRSRDEEFELLLGRMFPGARCYASTERFAISYPLSTSLDTRSKQKAVRAFEAFLGSAEAQRPSWGRCGV